MTRDTRDASPAERWRNAGRAERRRWHRRVVWRAAVADPYTYGMTPAEKRRANRDAMAALEAAWPAMVAAAREDVA